MHKLVKREIEIRLRAKGVPNSLAVRIVSELNAVLLDMQEAREGIEQATAYIEGTDPRKDPGLVRRVS